MRCALLLVFLAGCAEKLPARTLPSFKDYDAWCAQLRGAKCAGDWAPGKSGTSPIGDYRFVVIEASAIDTFGGGPSVSLELKTPHGSFYAPIGAIGSTGTTGETVLDVESVTAHGQVLDVRTHARVTSPKGLTDTQDATLLIAGAASIALGNVHLGTNSRDGLGRATGHFGTLKWDGDRLISTGTRLKDGEYRVAAP